MNNMKKENSFFSNITFSKKILFIIGIIFILLGVILIFYSFKNEILDGNYIIKDVGEYRAKDVKKLDPGEIYVTKDIEYNGKGTYKITYKNYAKTSKDANNLLDGSTGLFITDILGDDYRLIPSEISINGKMYKMNDEKLVSLENIDLLYIDNSIKIEIPNDRVSKSNTIILSISLAGRDTSKRRMISMDTYYTFTPSFENDFYDKKTIQSYVIEGNGYIKLAKKG